MAYHKNIEKFIDVVAKILLGAAMLLLIVFMSKAERKYIYGHGSDCSNKK